MPNGVHFLFECILLKKTRLCTKNYAFISFPFVNYDYFCVQIDKIMHTYHVKELLEKGKGAISEEVTVQGWVRSFRSNRFIALNDGSTIKNIQVVVDFEIFDADLLKKITTATSLKINGE